MLFGFQLNIFHSFNYRPVHITVARCGKGVPRIFVWSRAAPGSALSTENFQVRNVGTYFHRFTCNIKYPNYDYKAA